MPETIDVLVDGGEATAGPPLGPALGPMGVNIIKVVEKINEKTKHFDGMKVPVKVIVDQETKNFEIEVGTPPTSALVMREAGLEKGAGAPRSEIVGDLTIDQVKKIAEMKHDSLLGKTVKDKAMEVIGTCVSMGVSIEGNPPKEMKEKIRAGEFDSVLSG